MSDSYERPRWNRFDWGALAALAALGAAVRFVGLERLPPALWFDEGLNGFDALTLARGAPWRLVFPDVFPREPLQIWLTAAFVKAFGPQTIAVRLPSALVGALAAPLAYLWLRQAASRRVALWSAVFLAGMRWHVHFSRMAFRTIWTPSLALGTLALLWLAFRTGRKRWAAASGILFGAGFYAYLSWYFFVPAAGLAVGLGLWRESERRRRGALAAAFCLAAVLVAAPMAVHYARVPEDFLGRPRAVSPLAEGSGSAFSMIWKNAREASVMVFWRGDHVSKHNIPWKPALEPIGAALFLAGLVRCALALRKSAVAATLLGWFVLGTLPTVFSKTDSPNFLRTLLITPAVAAFVGFGADWMAQWIERRSRGQRLCNVIPSLCVGVSVAAMLFLYFVVWARLPPLWHDFSGQADQIARYARSAREGEQVFVPAAICLDSYTYRFLAADARRARPFSPSEAFGPGPQPGDDHLIVESDSIDPRVRSAIARHFPKAELAEQFPVRGVEMEGRPWVWARAWRLRPGDRMDAKSAQALWQATRPEGTD